MLTLTQYPAWCRVWHVFRISGVIISVYEKDISFDGFDDRVDVVQPTKRSDAIANALKTADAGRVRFFDEFVDIKLLEKPEVKNMGRNQAAITLKTFFSENGIKGFETTSQREMSGTMYLTGKLVNSTKGYNITIMMKGEGKQMADHYAADQLNIIQEKF
jgi:hypothetical protein